MFIDILRALYMGFKGNFSLILISEKSQHKIKLKEKLSGKQANLISTLRIGRKDHLRDWAKGKAGRPVGSHKATCSSCPIQKV